MIIHGRFGPTNNILVQLESEYSSFSKYNAFETVTCVKINHFIYISSTPSSAILLSHKTSYLLNCEREKQKLDIKRKLDRQLSCTAAETLAKYQSDPRLQAQISQH